MARNRTPTAILNAKGSFVNRPSRKRARSAEPSPVGELGNPPARLSKEEKQVWRELSRQLLPGVACAADRSAFEMLVRLVAQSREDFATMKTGDKQLILTIASKFGMNPADRSKVAVEKPAESELEKFLSKRKEKPADETSLVN